MEHLPSLLLSLSHKHSCSAYTQLAAFSFPQAFLLCLHPACCFLFPTSILALPTPSLLLSLFKKEEVLLCLAPSLLLSLFKKEEILLCLAVLPGTAEFLPSLLISFSSS